MTPNKEEVTYELQILKGGSWQTNNVYTADEHNIAIADAKSMQSISTVQAVKLIKEFYDEKAGIARQRTIYENPKPKPKPKPEPKVAPKVAAKAQPKPAAKPKPKPAAKPKSKPAAKPKSAKPKKKAKPGKAAPKKFSAIKQSAEELTAPDVFSGYRIFMQTIFSLLISLGAAFIVSWVASFMLKDANHFPVITREKLHAVVFFGLFVLFSLLLAARIAFRNHVFTLIRKAREKAMAERSFHDPRLSLPPEAIEEHAPPLIPIEPEPEPAEEDADDLSLPEEALADELDTLSDELKRDLVQFPAEVQSTIKKMETFVEQSLRALEGGMTDADPYASFGVSLYMIGAAQALCHENNIDKNFRDDVLGEGLIKVGLAQDRINHLIDRSDEYLISDPRYTQMYQVGRSAMGGWLESGLGAEEAFALSYENWIKPRPKPASSPPVVVLFTDIAGSTAMTQVHGDEAAQEVVRDHNRIVREAISAHMGREIKHTGDGIMASFVTGVSGVEAAIEMQRMVKAMVDKNADNPLELKIGINVGEPISEENDLFGATVQLAARIVDKAQSGEILISEAVHGLTSGKNIPFEKHDEFEMKGFEHPITTYRVKWKKT